MLTVADTAFPIAVIRAEESGRPPPERLFEDPYASLFAAAGAHAHEGTQRFLNLPFFRDGIRLRTRFIDDSIRDGLAAGLTQIVLLGAGFDSRGLRMPEIAAHKATVYEIDFADLLDKKHAILAAAGVTPPFSVTYVACDLQAPDFEETLTAGLEERGFRLGEGALFVCEGILEYINKESANQSLALMAHIGGPGSRLIFTFGHGTFDPETASERMRRMGFTACEELGFDELWRRYLPGEPHENAWIARLGVARV